MRAASENDPQEVPPSRFFRRETGALSVEGHALSAIADEVGTPTYVYSRSALTAAYEEVTQAMGTLPHLVAYAIKANGNLAILRHLASLGCGADIVSAGELWRATRAGIPPSKIVFSGVGKRDEEIEAALEADIRAIHVESEPELERVAEIAKRRGAAARVALRVNPDVDAKTHPYIATGLHDTKFGLELPRARALLPRLLGSPHLLLEGVACHIGSQLETTAPLTEAVALLSDFARECVEAGAPLRSIDVGGGWPMAYGNERAPYPSHQAFGDAIRSGLQNAPDGLEVITEPGRALVGDAGALLTRVIYVKRGGGEPARRFVIVDAAMTELIRPALYEAYHAVDLVEESAAARAPADVVGPVCESGDFLALGRHLPVDLTRGDLLLIRGAGAYGREMASAYNARPPAAEVLADEESFRVVRRRASVASLSLLEEE